tara:strand:- start:219 stop:557 length:339 start_codon:yes stop_codon:yes gene_type:complete
MESTATILHILIALVGIVGSGLSVFVGVKVALAEAKKDITSLRIDMTRHEIKLEKHIDAATHPTAEQVKYLSKQHERTQADIREMAAADDVSHSKIEAKIDAIMNRLLDGKK